MTTTTERTRIRVTGATEALDAYLARQGTGRPRPPLRYLRRKPGRGLVAVFGPGDGGDIYTVSLDERSLLDESDGDATGPTIQQFPVDPKLPHLDTVMAPSQHPSLAAALESTAREFHEVPADWRLLDVAAEPVRYKPGNRCVIRYRLLFGDPSAAGGAGTATRTCTLVAKLYQEMAEADDADDLLSRLRDRAAVTWTAQPLGVVPGLPLALTEDLGSGRDPVPARSGLDVVHPGSEEALEVVGRAARALAELHTSGLDTGGLSRRTGADEAGKAAKRAGLLEQYVPELAPVLGRIAGTLSATLAALPSDTLRPAHGSYKASQLLVRNGAVFLVDFDQFCLADPALDVGYFLAYLRPAGFWYHRAGRRAWFEAAAETFVSTYLRRLAERGESAATCADVPAVPTCSRPRCCSRSRRAAPTGCTAPAPERWRRCSTRSPACSRRPGLKDAGRGPQPARFSSINVPSFRLVT